MLQRCSNPSRADWPRYGGRRITVCDRWRHFENFLADLGACPAGLTLDRIDNNGNYEPGNCQWTTWEQQIRNRRSNSGERHPNAKLSVDEVEEIRRLARRGVPYRRLGSLFGISGTNVGYIVRREAWRHLARAADLDGSPIEL
jgi:hypothetical protein